MLVLHENIKFLRSIGMLLNENQMCESPKGIAYNIAFLVPLTLTLAGMTAYCVTHLTNLAVATQVLYNMAAICIYWIIYLVFALQKPIIRDILAELQMLVLHRQNQPHFQAYQAIEEKCVQLFRTFIKFFSISVSFSFFLPFFLAAYLFVCGAYTNDVWFLQFPVVVPYDETTVIGYSITTLIQSGAAITAMAIMIAINSLFFGICWYVDGLLNDLMTVIRALDVTSQLGNANQSREAILFHNSIINFLDHFNAFFQGPIFITFALSILWICSALFQFQYAVKTVDTFLLQCIVSCTIAISNIFVYCYFGQNVTTKFMQVTDVVYATNWYGFPLVQQKALLLNMMRVQRPFYFTGYYISSCSLSTFQAILNKAFSYCMMLRAIE